MMLATWLVEFYLSKCNELDDLVASESVSQDVANLQAERAMVEDDLKHFFETYKVSWRLPSRLRIGPLMCQITDKSRSRYSLRAYPRTWTDRNVSALCNCHRGFQESCCALDIGRRMDESYRRPRQRGT